MKIRFTLFASLCVMMLFGFSSMAQTYHYNNSIEKTGFSIKSQKSDNVVVNYSIDKFELSDIMVKGEEMKNISLKGHFLPNNEGAPNLPGNGRYIAVPQGANVTYEIVNVKKETIENVNIAPSPRIPKDNEQGPLDFTKDKILYAKDAFYPVENIKVSEKQNIRGVDVVMLGITPFQYNPVTKQLIVFHEMEIKINYEGGNGIIGDNKYRSRWFDPILEDAVLNRESLPKVDYSKNIDYNAKTTGCEYLIVSPDGAEFQQWADSIKLFRNQQGILTKVVTLSEIGGNTPNVLENYFDDIYATWDIVPAAVLLLGDYGDDMNNRITSPIYDNYCVSDNIYADVTGNHLPDMVFARITAQNADQLEVMVNKFINYEKNPPTSASFYNTPITALGWQTERWFQICSETINGFWRNSLGKEPHRENCIYSGNTNTWSSATNTSTVTDYFGPEGTGYIEATPDYLPAFDGSAGGVTDAINAGSFMLQHRDHGGETGWGEPSFSNSDIDNLTNTDLTFIMSINCLTGKYNISGECFAEKFHRHTYNGEPAGALGLIAASEVSYSFVNDTYVWGAYDNMWPEFLPDYGSNPEPRGIKPAFGNAAGKYYLEQSDWPYNTNNKEVTYNLFHHHGGAFLTVYSEVPQDLTVSHNSVLLSGPDFFEVTADEGALIALSVDGEIIGTATGTASPVDVNIESQLPGTIVDIVITKQNYYRYHQQVSVIPPDGPYVIKNSYEINDATGNNNQLADFGETLQLSLTVENVGNDDAEDVTVSLSTDDPYVTIVDGTEDYGTIPAESTMTIANGFEIVIAEDIPDQHNVSFSVVASGVEDWTSSLTMKLYAPVLNITSLRIVETDGNGNGRLDPGETADVFITAQNTGHSAAPNVLSSITTTTPSLIINSAEANIESLESESEVEAQFNVSVNGNAMVGSVVSIVNNIASEPYNANKTFDLKVGLILEDWETGDFTQYEWNNTSSSPWEVNSTNTYEGEYALQSGPINDNGNTEITLPYNVMVDDFISFYRKVSSEASYDKLHFYIDGVEKGVWSGDLDWEQFEYPVTAGEHIFKWTYTKDGSQSNGDDCAWIDYIILPPELATTVYAGSDIDMCDISVVALTQATATYYETAVWTTTGTGIFNGMDPINKEYTPSQEDYDNGEVTLTLTVTGPGDDVAEDDIVIRFHEPVELTAVEEFNLCVGDNLTVEGVEAANYTTISWTTAGTGSFEDATLVNPIYTPSAEDITAGNVDLTVTAAGPGICEDVTITVPLHINALPTAIIENGEASVCPDEAIDIVTSLTGAAPWTININGEEVETDDASYNYSFSSQETADITIVTVVDANGCANIGEGIFTVNINPLPEVAATPVGQDTIDLVYDTESEYTTLSAANATAYAWFVTPEEAATITVTDTTANVAWNTEWTGVAQITVTAQNDCGDGETSAALEVLVKNTTGVSEFDANNMFTIYPNPNNGSFKIMPAKTIGSKVNITVTNAVSNVVFTDMNVNIDNGYQIDIKNLAKGVYFVIINNDNNQLVKRLIIK